MPMAPLSLPANNLQQMGAHRVEGKGAEDSHLSLHCLHPLASPGPPYA